MCPTSFGVAGAGGLTGGAAAAERGLCLAAAAGREWIAGLTFAVAALRTLGQAMRPADQATPASVAASASALPAFATGAVRSSSAGANASMIGGHARARR